VVKGVDNNRGKIVRSHDLEKKSKNKKVESLTSKEFVGRVIFRITCEPRVILREACELIVKFQNISSSYSLDSKSSNFKGTDFAGRGGGGATSPHVGVMVLVLPAVIRLSSQILFSIFSFS
jgi:hypothetical protein